MMLRRMKLKPRTLTCLVCCPIAKVYAAVGEAVVERSRVTGVRKAGPGTKSKIELESRMLALGNFLRFLFKKTDSQVLSFPLSAIS